VRELASHAEIARERVARALEAALRDESPAVRAAAATGLADIEGSEALSSLLVAVEDDDAYVRQMAIAALGEIGDPRSTERMRRALGDKRPEVRFQAVMAFPRVCAQKDDAIEALVQSTHDEDPIVCHIALRMAEEVDDDRGPRAGSVPPPVLDRARSLAGHASPLVRVACAILLARAGEATSHGVLVSVANGDVATSDGEDEAAAIELCGELALADARPGLERRAFGGFLGLRRDRFAWHARVALARMGHERARRDIVRELGSADRDRRTLAVAAAGRARLADCQELLTSMRDRGRVDATTVDEALELLRPEP
jgi:HEAT repeat protein